MPLQATETRRTVLRSGYALGRLIDTSLGSCRQVGRGSFYVPSSRAGLLSPCYRRGHPIYGAAFQLLRCGLNINRGCRVVMRRALRRAARQ
jgi:hypothetical protein